MLSTYKEVEGYHVVTLHLGGVQWMWWWSLEQPFYPEGAPPVWRVGEYVRVPDLHMDETEWLRRERERGQR